MYRIYGVVIRLNDILFGEVWIDSHYEEKHSESINDELILSLLRHLSGQVFTPNSQVNGYSYYVIDVYFQMKPYRLVLVIPDHHNYLGVRTVYRRSK